MVRIFDRLCGAIVAIAYIVVLPAAIVVPAGIKTASAARSYELRDQIAHAPLVSNRRSFSSIRLAAADNAPADTAPNGTVKLKYAQSIPFVLERPAGQESIESGAELHALTRDIQRELYRVGCLQGHITGRWDSGTKAAAALFLTTLNAVLPLEGPEPVLWHMLDKQKNQVCSLDCPVDANTEDKAQCGIPIAGRLNDIYMMSAATDVESVAGQVVSSAAPTTVTRSARTGPIRREVAERQLTPPSSGVPVARVQEAAVGARAKAAPAQPERQRIHVTTSSDLSGVKIEAPSPAAKPAKSGSNIEAARAPAAVQQKPASDFGQTFNAQRSDALR